jgi:hypothetical protein
MNPDPARLGPRTSWKTYEPSARARVFSVYEPRDGTRIWIITEANRSVTTIFLPEEY